MTYSIAQHTGMGDQDLNGVYTAGNLGAPGIAQLPAVTCEAQLGEILSAWDPNSTTGGGAEFIFLAVPVSTAVTAGLVYTWNAGYNILVVPTSLSSTTTSGAPLAVAINTVTSNASSIQYTWFQIQGRATMLRSGTLNRIQPSVPLYLSSVTAGRIRATASTLRTIIGIRSANVATVASTTSTILVYLHRPSIGSGI